MDGQWRPIRTAFPEWCFGRQRMRRPISHWKLSRTARQEESSSQVSHPQSSIGRTQVSKILHVDSGFRSPWKAPRLPRAKKAFLAFLTFSFTDFDADRFDCQIVRLWTSYTWLLCGEITKRDIRLAVWQLGLRGDGFHYQRHKGDTTMTMVQPPPVPPSLCLQLNKQQSRSRWTSQIPSVATGMRLYHRRCI